MDVNILDKREKIKHLNENLKRIANNKECFKEPANWYCTAKFYYLNTVPVTTCGVTSYGCHGRAYCLDCKLEIESLWSEMQKAELELIELLKNKNKTDC